MTGRGHRTGALRTMEWVVLGGMVLVLLGLIAPGLDVGMVSRPEDIMARSLPSLVTSVADAGLRPSEPPLSFPQGDIGRLWDWLNEPGPREVYWHVIGLYWERDGRRVFVDAWDRPLVYRFPSLRKEAMFDLYSVGPNGIDDMGGGDDIGCWHVVEFNTWSSHFAEGIVDADWIRAHMHELQRDDKGKIIGAPPERLKEAKERRGAARE